MKHSITIAGSIIVDKTVTVDRYPKKGMCSHIISEKRNLGGCVCNTACAIKRIDPSFSVYASGVIGKDDDGKFAVAEMKKYGVDCTLLGVADSVDTGHAVVVCDEESLSRTFMTCLGTNALYSQKDVANCFMRKGDYFHLGYLFLLESLDKEDAEYGTIAARCLSDLQKSGVKTSIDMISEDVPENAREVRCAVKYCDNVIINEIEGGIVADVSPFENDNISDKNVEKICRIIKSMGVKERVIIHSPSKAYCFDGNDFIKADTYKLLSGQIKSSVGAGDAFCAGALYAISENYNNKKILSFANCVAACSLLAPDPVSGIKRLEDIEKMMFCPSTITE